MHLPDQKHQNIILKDKLSPQLTLNSSQKLLSYEAQSPFKLYN